MEPSGFTARGAAQEKLGMGMGMKPSGFTPCGAAQEKLRLGMKPNEFTPRGAAQEKQLLPGHGAFPLVHLRRCAHVRKVALPGVLLSISLCFWL